MPCMNLLSPISIGSMHLRNRVAMAPMTREFAEGGALTDKITEYYRRRAKGGVGLIITEGVPPEAHGQFSSKVPSFYGPNLEKWRQIVDAVHQEGCCVVPQLWHVGAFNPSLIGMKDSVEVDRRSPSG